MPRSKVEAREGTQGMEKQEGKKRRPSVRECLVEISRQRIVIARLERLVEQRRPDLRAARDVEIAIRDLANNIPRQLMECQMRA